MSTTLSPTDQALILSWWRFFGTRPVTVRMALCEASDDPSEEETAFREALLALASSTYPGQLISPNRFGKALVRLNGVPFTFSEPFQDDPETSRDLTIAFVDRGNLLYGRTWQLQLVQPTPTVSPKPLFDSSSASADLQPA
jgi:hypothetical protein